MVAIKKASGKNIKNKQVKAVKKSHKTSKEGSFPIVGIGGSAGSLAAFEQFFTNMPVYKGMSYVVIQHLLPNKDSLLPELISKSTGIPVITVTEEMNVEQDKIYVIAPGQELVIEKNKFRITKRDKNRGIKCSVDTFLTSLALSRKKKAIAIILSGMGNDGSAGIQEIKKNKGLVIVQDPKTSLYDSMPRKAIATGLADLVLPVEDMPEQVLSYVKNKYSFKLIEKKSLPENLENILKKILDVIRARTGNDFSFYKMNTIQRRIERRMQMLQITNMSQYLKYLEGHYSEAETLLNEMLIGVTNFFREPGAFQTLKEKIFPQLLKQKADDTVRVWIPACSTGEEVYSLLIVLIESLEKQGMLNKFKIQFFGTDLDQEAISTARLGIYSESISEHVSAERLGKFFIKRDNKYQIKKEFREMVVFATQSLIKDPPFTKLDVLSCRNFLIYLNSDMQKKIISLFHYSLKPNGILFLGSSETVNTQGELFTSLSSKYRIFKRKETPSSFTGILHFPLSFFKGKVNGPETKGIDMNKKIKIIPGKVQQTLLDNYAPPSVVISGAGDILYINGDAGKFLELSPGPVSLNILKVVREGLKFELIKAMHEVNLNQNISIHKNLWVKCEAGYKMINLTVRPFNEKDMEGLLLVSFEEIISKDEEEAGKKKKKKSEGASDNETIKELEKELKYTKAHLQSTIQEMEATLEEMTSNNEEIQSTNEELQSANEELTTSKEELQSLNEELVTVNAELNSKMDEYSQVNNDIKNLLDSTDIATVFLDNNLNIKRFTSHAKNIFKLIPVDIGRPITDIVSNLKYQDFIKDVRSVLENLAYKRAEVENLDGHWYEMRILPYRTTDNYIGGAVVTFTDITKQRNLENTLKSLNSHLEKIINAALNPMVIMDGQLKVKMVNHAFYKKFKVKEKSTVGQFLFDLGNKQWDISDLKKALLEILPQRKELEGYRVKINFPEVGIKDIILNARKLEGLGDEFNLILLSIEDVIEK